MCHFITTILPKDAKIELLKSVYKNHGFDFRKIDAFHLEDQIEKGDFCVQTSRGMCDCGTILGSLRRDFQVTSSDEEFYAESIQRFRKKGWSEEHIKNWIEKAKEEYFLRGVKRKFKNKNLSETKIQKWKEQNAENSKKYEVSETEREKQIESSAPLTKQWIDFLKAVADSDYTNRISVLLHDYSGKHGNKIKIQHKEVVPIQELTPKILLEVKEDVIYEFFN